ncbi:MAG: hypothetical protein ACRD02_14980, partial [Acidimicrobiia bacterium]
GPGTFADVLAELGAGSRYRSRAFARLRGGPARGRRWRPQVVGFDEALSERIEGLPAGTVAADTYARGAHYLPIPSLASFRRAFRDWWSELPTGWEQRAFDAAAMIGWAAGRSRRGDLAEVLEGLRSRRFAGLDVTFGPDDHTAVGQTSVGLWVVPHPAARVPERRASWFEELPWVPLARGFSIDGERTDIQPRDWKHLFRRPPPPRAPAPKFSRMRFGVTTGPTDPFH